MHWNLFHGTHFHMPASCAKQALILSTTRICQQGICTPLQEIVRDLTVAASVCQLPILIAELLILPHMHRGRGFGCLQCFLDVLVADIARRLRECTFAAQLLNFLYESPDRPAARNIAGSHHSTVLCCARLCCATQSCMLGAGMRSNLFL